MTFHEYLKSVNACSPAVEWADDKTVEEVVAKCHRGDWLLWLAKKCDIGLQPLTLAKGHCANTVRHLMKDEQSIKAVDTAIAFGEGRASREELDAAASAAARAYDAADSNRQQTADICRKYIGDLIIDDQRVVGTQITVTLGFSEQDAVGHQLDIGVLRQLVGKTHLVTDGMAQRAF